MLQRVVLQRQGQTGAADLVVSLTSIGSVGEGLRRAGVEVIALDMVSPAMLPSAIARLVRLFKERKPEIVQTWMYHADLLGGLVAKLAGVSYVVWGIRTTEIAATSGQLTRLIRWMCARLSGTVPSIILCAADASRRSHAAIGYRADIMRVIPNGFDLQRFRRDDGRRADFRARMGIPADALVIASIGRYHPVKNHPLFLEAAASACNALPKAVFVMAGRHVHPSNQELHGLTVASGAPERFHLLGEVRDVEALLAATDILCMHSLSEGFPNIVAEAMCCEVPCVVTDVGDAALLVGATGTVVPSGDAEGLAAALIEMARRTDIERRELGRLARSVVEGQFSMQACVEQFDALYSSLRAGGGEVNAC